MWWRFLTFCLLVSFILIVVLNYLHDRPVVRLFFKRCCDEGIENDQVVFESFSNNYLKERLIAVEIDFDNGTFVPEDVDIGDVIEDLRRKLNVHDPSSRKKFEVFGREFEGVEDFKEELDDDKEDVIDIEKINVPDMSVIGNQSDITEAFASDIISDSRNFSDIETKDDVNEQDTVKPDTIMT